MDQRLRLRTILSEAGDTVNLYYQPPETIKMVYPCIVYSRGKDDTKHADNVKYIKHRLYEVTYITRDPDDTAPDHICELPFCRRVRAPYTADNLYHHSFEIYF